MSGQKRVARPGRPWLGGGETGMGALPRWHQLADRREACECSAAGDGPPPGAADVARSEPSGLFSNRPRITLMGHYLALFGAVSVKYLLTDHKLIGGEWLRYLRQGNVPFTIRVRDKMTICT